MNLRSVAVALTLASGVCAAAFPVGAADPYLPKGAAPQTLQVLPPPPAAGTGSEADDRAAFDRTRALKSTNPARWALAVNDVEQTPEAAFIDFSCALGVQLDDGSAPVLSNLFARMQKDARAVVDPPKDSFARKRPFVGHDGDICVEKTDALAATGSYPSGHTTLGWSWALVLAELAPDRATEILARGRAYGESRVVCGVHYPSDIEAGRTNGASLVAALHGSPEFRADLDKARAEVDAARKAARVTPDAGMCRAQAAILAPTPWLAPAAK